MKSSVAIYLTILAIVISAPDTLAQPSRKTHFREAAPLDRAHQALTSVIVHDIFSPPVSSRIYAYAHIAAYEILAQGDSNYRSLKGQINDFHGIKPPEGRVSLHAAAVHAFLLTGKRLIFSEKIIADSIQNIMAMYRKILPRKILNASLQYGEEVSREILAWAESDRYNETRKLVRYNLIRDEGKWVPTPPSYMAAVEPNWRKIRPFTLDSAAMFKPIAPPPFSRDTTSEFYGIAQHVYNTCRQLTDDQKAIANFWDCNPFAVNVHGHINFATKKLSPGGHWLSIAGIAAAKEESDIIRTSAAYTLTAIALFDAFISCWDEKYRSNLIRPETYINTCIDEQWKPLLQTPPFPEYTSGHSVISTASAMVLSRLFGDRFSFVDTSELAYGYPARTFRSFMEASEEAALSRLYGGIHYLPAIRHGQTQGKKVGEHVLQRINLRRSEPARTYGSSTNASSPGR